MLETGKVYKVTTLVNLEGVWDEESGVWTVTAVEGSCARLSNNGSENKVVDTASWNFVSAEAVE
ncbi:hypothetical protein V3H18_10725 [Methylocystis sp. 9N]|uniref:Uncharacterized protein n=1 Tax=Methylocystis borbori TaxID=3118750 RepID=A0ABU7XHZ5_9HYPH